MAAVADGIEHHFGALASAYPVALHVLEGVGPFEFVEAGKEPFRIGRYPELPLAHLLLHHRETAAYAQSVLDLVVGEHCAEPFAPVHAGFTEIGYTVAHEHLFLFLFGESLPLRGGDAVVAFGLEPVHEFGYRPGLVFLGIVPALEHLQECPLRPLVVVGVAGAERAVPVEGETEPVKLAAIAGHVLVGGFFGVLPGLDGILLRREAEGVVAHRMQHVKALEPLVSGIDIACYVA